MVSTKHGGMFGAFNACVLLRIERQVIKARSRSKTGTVPTCTPYDECAIVMHHASLEDANDMFIRDVKTLRKTSFIVCYDHQLNFVPMKMTLVH